MEKFKGTRGEWVLEKNNHFYEVYAGVLHFNAMIFCNSGNHSDENKANAKLISCAPEMLYLLQECLDTFSCVEFTDKDLKSRIEKLITKATTI